jgi:hypothetical protein
MSWIREQFERRMHANNLGGHENAAEISFESEVEHKWKELREGLKRDVVEYRRLGGTVALVENSDLECRIANQEIGVAALITADPEAHTVQYTFESDNGGTAVPEGGFFSMRSSRQGAQLYSADQRVSLEACRRMILEPLLFPTPPRTM